MQLKDKSINSNKFLIIDKISKKIDIKEGQIKTELDKNSANQITEAENVDIEDIFVELLSVIYKSN